MIIGSLFSGIGGFDLGLNLPVSWQVERDKDCNRVLAHHFPEAKRFNDVKEVGKDNLSAVDLICGGFPCQDLSVAGKRAGLDGERSGLWFEFHRIIRELTPQWVLIENVPGLLSSNGGRDFAVILSGLAELGYMSAWRILDAQYFGVAQRRRRVFIVASLGDGRAAQVLFESPCGCGHPPARQEAGKGVARNLAPSLSASGRGTSQCGESRGQDPLICAPLTSNPYGDHESRDSLLVPDISFALNACKTKSGRFDPSEETFIAFQPKASVTQSMNPSEICPTIGITKEPAVAFTERTRKDGRTFECQEELSYALTNPGAGGRSHCRQVIQNMLVRRLTPTECLRLQGFPDDWLSLDPPLSDSAKYRMTGNAVAVPVIRWIGKRILESS